jgi:hypothetical protein
VVDAAVSMVRSLISCAVVAVRSVVDEAVSMALALKSCAVFAAQLLADEAVSTARFLRSCAFWSETGFMLVALEFFENWRVRMAPRVYVSSVVTIASQKGGIAVKSQYAIKVIANPYNGQFGSINMGFNGKGKTYSACAL